MRSFFGQDKNAQIFVPREDEQGKTHVVFGDGVNGARLPTGTNNVVASYRYGGGCRRAGAGHADRAAQPAARPEGASRNPLAPTGGADADPPARIRTLAPRSVLTFGRAVSLDDYEAIAVGAPGVVQAQAAYAFDPAAQRPVVTLLGRRRRRRGGRRAGGAGRCGRSEPPGTRQCRDAARCHADRLTYVRDPTRDDATVRAGLNAALLDPDSGLFGVNAVGIGQVIYDSQIYPPPACAVPGVVAVHGLAFRTGPQFVLFRSNLLRLASVPAAHDSGAAELQGSIGTTPARASSSRCRMTATTYCCRGRS